MKSLFTWEKRKTKLSLPLSVVPFLLIVRFYGELRYTIATSISRKIFSLEQHLLPRAFSSRSSIEEKKPYAAFPAFPFSARFRVVDPDRVTSTLSPLRREKRKEEWGEGGKKREEPVLYSFNVHSTKRWNQRLLYYRGEGRCSSIPEREAVVKLPTRRNMIPIPPLPPAVSIKSKFRLRLRS